jgi:hypothetical protein
LAFQLISGGITLKNRSVNILDVEKTITNVTIKDAPFEVSDCYIATQMMKYGEIIPESVRRGYIKGTNIENGSRYLQIIKCAPTLPHNSILTALIVLVSLLSPSLLSTLFVCDVCCASCSVVFLPSIISGA